MKEIDVQNSIRIGVADIALIFRANVGGFKTEDGRYITTGLPAGFPDLFGVRKSDGKAVFIEVKNEKGKPSEKQLKMGEVLKSAGANWGIARSVEEARRIINEN